MNYTAHIDTFARDHLPPPDQWPDLLFDLPELRYPERLNCAVELLDRALERGWGERAAILAPGGLRWTYAELTARANRIAHVLVEDMRLVPGNRVLLRGPSSPMMAACWFAVMKAGGVAVATMPLLRAKELTDIITKAPASRTRCAMPASPRNSMLRARPVRRWPRLSISKRTRRRASRRALRESPRILPMLQRLWRIPR